MKITDAQLLLLDTYETGYGIFNHAEGSDRPLALVAMQWCEDNTHQSTLHERIDQFRERQVYQTFGLNLTEFLALPRDIVTKILDSCGKKQQQEDTIASQLQNRFDNLGKG